MKYIKILTALFFIGTSLSNAQNVQSNNSRTSGGLEAGGATSGTGNTFYGYQAGKVCTSTGTNNTFIGHQSGKTNTTGKRNVYVGNGAGLSSNGSSNIFIGDYTGANNNSGVGNVFLGTDAGQENDGSNNTYVGHGAGLDTSGSNNVFIGHGAGGIEQGNNKLFIDNTDTTKPLIWGDFALDQLKFNAKVGIGYNFGNFPTTAGSVNVSAYNLFVKGGILTEEVRVMLQTDWADYVFAKEYQLPTLSDVEDFITTNGHLPNVPSANQIKEEGIALGEMAKIQQEKIEELTLYIIEQNKINEKQSKDIQELKGLIETLISKK